MKKMMMVLFILGVAISMVSGLQAEEHKIIASDGAAGDEFGRPVAIDADTAVAGAHADDDNGSDSGSAYIYYRNQGGTDNWGEVVKITSSDSAAGDGFGVALSISGDTVIIGADGDDDNGSDSGSAYIFYRDQGGLDNWGEVIKLTAGDGVADDAFGAAVAVKGDIAVVGAWGDDDNGPNSGSVYVFYRDQGGLDNWGQVTKITAFDGADDDNFGRTVSRAEDIISVAAYNDDDNGGNSGSVYIYYQDQGGADNWGLVTKLLPLDGASGDQFGRSLSNHGGHLIAGAWQDDDYGISSGSAYIFRRHEGGMDNWGQVTKLIPDDGVAYDNFGSSVAITAGKCVVGAAGEDDNGSRAGAAYVFYRHLGGTDNWGQMAKLLASDGAADDELGRYVACSGGSMLCGAFQDDSDTGSAYIYDGFSTVSQVLPASASHTAPVDTDLWVELSDPVNAAAVTSDSLMVHAGLHAPVSGVFSGGVNDFTLNPTDDFFAGEIVQAVVTDDLVSDPYVWQFRIASTGGSAEFSDSGQTLGSANSRAACLADVDGDGDLDAVIANQSNESNTLWINDGTGTFALNQTFGDANSTMMIALGDLDGDGDLDGFMANDGQPNEVWFYDDVLGEFVDSGQAYGSTTQTQNATLADMDGDGDLDLITANQSGANSRLALNDGTGSFTNSGQIVGTGDCRKGGIGDLDSDGDMDVFMIRHGDSNLVYLNDGSGVFTDSGQNLGSYNTSTLSLGDIDNDGDIDAVTGGGTGPVRFWINDGSATFTEDSQTLGTGWQNVKLGDLDGDADLDIAVGRDGDANHVYLNDGAGTFTDSLQTLGTANTRRIALGDLDNDGDIDIFAPNDGANIVWLNDDLPTPTPTITPSPTITPTPTVTATPEPIPTTEPVGLGLLLLVMGALLALGGFKGKN